MPAAQITNYEKNIDNIIFDLNKARNFNTKDNISNNFIKLTMESLKNGSHPVLNPQNFAQNIIPLPNATLFDSNTNKYSGNLFMGNNALALDLFSVKNKYQSRAFVSLDDLKRFNISKYIDIKNIIDINNSQDKYSDMAMSNNNIYKNKQYLKLINVETIANLVRTPSHPKGVISEKEFNSLFPDYNLQKEKQKEYSNKLKNVLNKKIPKKPSENEENYPEKLKEYELKKKEFDSLLENIKKTVTSGFLPKLTSELYQIKYCQIIGKEYKPRFSKEEHLKDIVDLYNKNPQLLQEEIKKSGYDMQKALNLTFNEDNLTRIKENNLSKNPHTNSAEKNMPSLIKENENRNVYIRSNQSSRSR